MVECAAEKELPREIEVEPISVITGDNNYKKFLYYQLKMSIRQADAIDIVVSFLMESGVRMLLKDLQSALDRGVKIRLLTGNYLGITQPAALYLIKKELGNRVDLRFYNDTTRSFHSKAYIFHYGDEGEIFIGSSNISRSALTAGIEWNYRLIKRIDEESFTAFYETFNDLFEHHSIVVDDAVLQSYSKSWHKPSVAKDLERYDIKEDENTRVSYLFQPRGAQIEALYALNSSREEGATKGVVQAATGVGKTYLAAFDSVNFKRVLFVAHREEILRQAAESFKNVRPADSSGFFMGQHKDTDKQLIFASVATLGKEKYLSEEYFPRDYFDYMVVDEFHHAVNKQYRNIVEYFTPKFLLGLTATPDRMDGRNIFELCDYNVPYVITLQEAINKGMLVPFHYYGVYDETDYSGMRFVGGRYNEQDLNAAYVGNKRRSDLIYKHYLKYRSQRALGFCCSRLHAEMMAKDFCERGVPAVAVYSDAQGEFAEDRKQAISKLVKGEIKVIFSVDMFNEGVDIPSVDMVMFLRPTESPIVFLQQLGRGLRTYKGKHYLNVLDFIGNYAKAERAPFMLAGKTTSGGRTLTRGELEYPDDCIVDFDMPLLDLFQRLEQRRLHIKERIQQDFVRVQEFLGKVPTRMELFTYMDDDIYYLCLKNAKENIFKNYLAFKEQMGLLTAAEQELCAGVGKEFVHLLETTDMTKVYKMPVLRAFYNGGQVRMAVTEQELLASWKAFFHDGTNWKDLKKEITLDEFRAISDKAHLSNILRNPVKFLKASGRGFFVERDGYPIALAESLASVVNNPAFVAELKDIIEYRTMEYYRSRYEGKE